MRASSLGVPIGNDYYHDLILDNKFQVHDNLHLIKSKLSWILWGRPSWSNSETKMENTMFIMMQTPALPLHEVHHPGICKTYLRQTKKICRNWTQLVSKNQINWKTRSQRFNHQKEWKVWGNLDMERRKPRSCW